MASKNYHITPEGPKRCKASLRSCPYASHFGSEESAFAAQQMFNADAEKRAKADNLETFLDNPDQRYVVNGSISYFTDSHRGSVRSYANTIEQRYDDTDVYPTILRADVEFYTQNGSFKPVEITVKRDLEVDKKNVKLAGTWKVKTETTLSEWRNFEKISQETALDFSDESKTKRSLVQIREIFRNGVVLGSTHNVDDEHIEAETDRLFENFKTAFNALESETEGDFEMWERGYGYFQGSDGQTIVANEDYQTSAFRVENFRRFLQTNPYYASYVPKAEIRVTDQNKNTGDSWAVYKTNDKWYVSESKPDGSGFYYECTDHRQVYTTVKRIVLESIDPGDEARAREKASYASDLMNRVEYHLEEHEGDVAKYWDQMKAKSTANNRMKTNADLYGDTKEDKSVMRTIFDVFT